MLYAFSFVTKCCVHSSFVKSVLTFPQPLISALGVAYQHTMTVDIPTDGTPVPADFVIAQRVQLKNIHAVAKDLGLLESEFELYGNAKAKVR